MAVDIGQKAPGFELKNQDKEMMNLDQFKGRPVVMVFFPLAFSPVCTVEMGEFSNDLARFNEANAQVLGISVDSPYALKAFSDARDIKFPMLSDFNKEVSQVYGVMHEDLGGLRGVSKRSVFVLDSDHIVRYKWVTDDPKVEPNYQEIMNFVDTLRQPVSRR